MPERYPAIGDYALIAGSNSVALVSRAGSIDWCCIQRIDAGSCFGRLLDWEKGGFCSISPKDGSQGTSRRYLDETLVLETTFHADGGVARLYDFYALPASTREYPYRQLVRILEGVSGSVEFDLRVVPRFDYGSLMPWIGQEGLRVYSAIGGNDGPLISTDDEIWTSDDHALEGSATVHAGERVRLSFLSVPPEQLDYDRPAPPESEELDRRLEQTVKWWQGWSSELRFKGPYRPGVLRSAITIMALMNDLTGAVAAAATTSLPESPSSSVGAGTGEEIPPTTTTGASWRRSSMWPPSAGRNPTAASGNSAMARSTSSTRR